ncbi:hypothetical protein Neosp_011157 [[Neocosmospora] mangrovei]
MDSHSRTLILPQLLQSQTLWRLRCRTYPLSPTARLFLARGRRGDGPGLRQRAAPVERGGPDATVEDLIVDFVVLVGSSVTTNNANQPLRPRVELAAINRRLDYITNVLSTAQPPPVTSGHMENQVFTGEEKLPFQLLGTGCMMTILGLGPGFAEELATLERHAASVGTGNSSRVRLIQREQALSALAAFSTHVHVWYPILRPRFSERYLSIISGPLPPGSETCMVLLVAALGVLAQQDHELGVSDNENTSELYLEAAMASLPAVLVDKSVESVQCLVLLSIYHCCLSKPYQAYDYAMIASFKVQNLLKYVGDDDGEVYEHVKRAYWAVLLLESELRIHFDVIGSGIWNHDDKVSLPDSRRAWQFDIETGSPQGSTTTPASNTSPDGPPTDQTQSYFLAEISMRRMLHRCNTAIRRTHRGEIVYAPNIALELELQLEEWYRYLPESSYVF